MVFEFAEEDVDIMKDKVRSLFEEGDRSMETVMALMELALEISVEISGGAVEGLSAFLGIASGAPILAEEYEGKVFSSH